MVLYNEWGKPDRAQAWQQPQTARDVAPHRQEFHNSHVSMGAGHWLKTAGILAPLAIGELVKDPDKRWRYIRLASVATALVSEAMWPHRIQRERGM
jgi:hypothetical protein